LGHYQAPAFVDNLVARWSVLPPGLYQPALSAMLLSVERVPQVLTALERGALPNVTLLGEQANLLRFYPSPDISARAIALLGAANTYRDEVIERYRPSLSLRGAPERGRQIFQARCAACHQVGADGQRLGPNLTGVKMYGKAAIATAILEPNSQIRANYETWLVQTRGRENYVGVVERPHPSTIVLRRPGGIPMTFPVSALEYYEPQGWSLMPNGLEQGLSDQDFADLLDFLMTYPQGGPAAAAPAPARPPAAPARATP
jgi:putative heme-binding domain-containing protein